VTEALQEGKQAPAFDLPGSGGGNVSLKGLKGKPFVLYFYPKDDTPGCTVEACEFGSGFPAFEKLGVPVYGVSPDSVASHLKFIKKFNLPFTLLADEDHAVAEAYGLWVEKTMFGNTYMGVQRATFLVDAEGKLAKVWPKVKPEGHAQEVLEAIQQL
jgi:peroxiredoxin Q/BCP